MDSKEIAEQVERIKLIVNDIVGVFKAREALPHEALTAVMFLTDAIIKESRPKKAKRKK